jgi:effector-binding domain-containing protein
VADSVRLVKTVARPTIVVARATTWSTFPTSWRSMLDEVYAALTAAGAREIEDGEPRWRNVMLYKDDVPNVEVGVLAAGPFSARGSVISSVLPDGAAATMTHRGSYADLDVTHTAVRHWCATLGHQLAGPRWEIYGHWRADPHELETEVYYLLR